MSKDRAASAAAGVIGRRWLFPSALLHDLDPDAGRGGRRPRRTARDWVVDFTCFLLAVGLGVAAADTLNNDANTPHALAVVDQLLGALSCAAVWLRRRWPLGLAIAMIPVGMLSNTAGGAGVVILFTLAVHRPFRYVAWIGGIALAQVPLLFWLRPDPDLPYAGAVAFTEMATLTVIAWGLFVRSKRQLMLSLRDRARRAETEAQLRAEQAQRLAREAIAREMHDVLAHRISLVALHAGALEVRPDLPVEQVRESAALLRTTAHQALEELRGAIGVLRGKADEEAPSVPQPTLHDIPRLVEQTRQAGAKIDFDMDVTGETSAALGRDAYRIVQEALTNAAKHAPGAPATVRVTGGPGEGVSVSVRNARPVPVGAAAVPGAGSGLIGLRERVDLAGGTLRHGPDERGEFVVSASLPWQ